MARVEGERTRGPRPRRPRGLGLSESIRAHQRANLVYGRPDPSSFPDWFTLGPQWENVAYAEDILREVERRENAVRARRLSSRAVSQRQAAERRALSGLSERRVSRLRRGGTQ